MICRTCFLVLFLIAFSRMASAQVVYYQAPVVQACSPSITRGGAGTELKKIFNRVGFVPPPNCICHETARIMDSHPPQWSLQNIRWIESRIRIAARNMGVEYRPVLIRQSIRTAVRRASRR